MQRMLSSTILSSKNLNCKAGNLFRVQQVFFSVINNDKQKLTTSVSPPPVAPIADLTIKGLATVGVSSFLAVR
jgi:hypothetical protein